MGMYMPYDYAVSQIYPANYGASGPDVVFVNNIIAGNTTEPSMQCDWSGSLAADESNQPIFDHNLFLNRGGAFFGPQCVDVSAKYGNLVGDPTFVNWTGYDYHLQSGSPAIDAGNTSVLQSLADDSLNLTTDFDNNPRVADATSAGYPILDIGAYEYTGVQDTQPTTIVLTPSEYAVDAGTQLSLSAQLVSAASTPTGSVAFLEDGNQIGTAQIDSNGQANLPVPSLVTGIHRFIAVYPAPGVTNSTLPPARSVLVIVVAGGSSTATVPTTTVIAAAPNPAYGFQTVTIQAKVTATAGGTPTGSVTFYDGSTSIGTGTLQPNNVTTISPSLASAGTHQLTATYSGDSSFRTSTSAAYPETVQLNPTTTVITSMNPNPVQSFSTTTLTANVSSTTGSISSATGTVTFSTRGTMLGTATLANGAASLQITAGAAGSYPVIATYSGDAAFATSASPSQTLTVVPIAVTVTLTSSENPSLIDDLVTFTTIVAPVNPPSSGTTGPTLAGTITFFDGTTELNRTFTNSAGIATFNTRNLAIGTHPITAVYAGTTSTSGATSPELDQVVQPYVGDYSLTVTPDTSTVYTGAEANFTVTAVPVNGFNYPLELSCSGVPANTRCAVEPNVISLEPIVNNIYNGPYLSTLKVLTTSPRPVTVSSALKLKKTGWTGGATVLACLCGALIIPRRLRKKYLRALKTRSILIAAILLGIFSAISGCSGGGTLTGGTPVGTYQITVKSSLGSYKPTQFNHSITVNLVVKSLF
jgi:hypothetical protein